MLFRSRDGDGDSCPECGADHTDGVEKDDHPAHRAADILKALLAKAFQGELVPQDPQPPECVVVDALQIEPVSKLKFPANREINREFCRFRPSCTIFAPNRRANSVVCS